MRVTRGEGYICVDCLVLSAVPLLVRYFWAPVNSASHLVQQQKNVLKRIAEKRIRRIQNHT